MQRLGRQLPSHFRYECGKEKIVTLGNVNFYFIRANIFEKLLLVVEIEIRILVGQIIQWKAA